MRKMTPPRESGICARNASGMIIGLFSANERLSDRSAYCGIQSLFPLPRSVGSGGRMSPTGRHHCNGSCPRRRRLEIGEPSGWPSFLLPKQDRGDPLSLRRAQSCPGSEVVRQGRQTRNGHGSSYSDCCVFLFANVPVLLCFPIVHDKIRKSLQTEVRPNSCHF